MVPAMLLAVQTAIASASMTIKWNTGASVSVAQRRPIVQYATLVSLNGRTASVRLADGSTRTFVAQESQLPALRALIGTRIAFRVTP